MSLSVYTLQSTWTTVWKQPHTLRWQDNASSCTKCAMLEFTLDILSSSNTLSARGSCKLVGVDHWRVLVSNILYLLDRHMYYLHQIHCLHMQVSWRSPLMCFGVRYINAAEKCLLVLSCLSFLLPTKVQYVVMPGGSHLVGIAAW